MLSFDPQPGDDFQNLADSLRNAPDNAKRAVLLRSFIHAGRERFDENVMIAGVQAEVERDVIVSSLVGYALPPSPRKPVVKKPVTFGDVIRAGAKALGVTVGRSGKTKTIVPYPTRKQVADELKRIEAVDDWVKLVNKLIEAHPDRVGSRVLQEAVGRRTNIPAMVDRIKKKSSLLKHAIASAGKKGKRYSINLA